MVKLRIREILKQRGITQAELARRLGVTPITVNGWATGRRLPSLEVLDRIAEITSTPIIQFFASERRPHSFPEASNKQQPIINQLIRNTLMKKLLLLLLMVVTTAVGSWAQTADETPLYTCLFGSDYNNKGISSYTESWTATNNDFTWTIANFNNNQNRWTSVKCGRNDKKDNKNYASIANITTSTAIPEVIDIVEINISTLTTANAEYVNSITLITSETNDFTTGKSVDIPKEAGVHKISVPEPAANLYYQIKVDCKGGTSNGFVEVTSVKYYEKKEEVDKSQPATKIDFSLDEDVTYTEVQTLELSTDGRDKDGNMLPIHYLISDEDFADETSPVYTKPIIVDKSMTVSAWVSDGTNVVEDVKAYKVEIPAQVPATPVAQYNGVEVGEDVTVYYGEKITISSLMADKLEIAKNDEAPVTVANPYDLEILENGVMYSVYGVNEEGKSGDYLLFEVTINKPEAPVVKFGETTVSEDGEFEVSNGTVVSVAPGKGSNEVVVTDEEENVVELVDGTFTLSENGSYMYTITSVSPVEGVESNTIVVSFEVTTTQTKTATFDFTSESGAYGMTVFGGNDTKFEENIKSVASNGVTAIFDGRYRIWKNTPNELRLAKETKTLNPGIITFVVPSNCLIQKITINGKVVKGLVCDTSGATLNVDSEEKDNQQTSVTAVNGLDEITIKAGTAAAQQINTITIEYVSTEAEDPIAPVVELDQNTTNYSNAKFNITADKGHHIWYFYKIVNPSAKMSVASAEEIEWDQKVEHYNHTVVPSTHISTLNPGQSARFGFAAYNPDTQAISPIVYKSVKPDGQLSGVEDVEVESGVEAEYFNLQGVRVAAPLAPGLYIERRGSKAVKVRIN